MVYMCNKQREGWSMMITDDACIGSDKAPP